MASLELEGSIPLYIDNEVYDDSAHDCIGPSILKVLNGERDSEIEPEVMENYRQLFGNLEPDKMLSEMNYSEGEIAVEDWIMIDEETEEAVLLQGKSYSDYNVNQEDVKNVQGYLSWLRHPGNELYEMLQDHFIVKVNAAGIKNPRDDFPQFEEGVRRETENGETVKIHADIYRVEEEMENAPVLNLFSD